MYKHLFSLLCVVVVGATASFAQRADNYVPTNDRNVKLTETNLPIAFINVKGKTIQRNERITARMKIIDNKDGKTPLPIQTRKPTMTVTSASSIAATLRSTVLTRNPTASRPSRRRLKRVARSRR